MYTYTSHNKTPYENENNILVRGCYSSTVYIDPNSKLSFNFTGLLTLWNRWAPCCVAPSACRMASSAAKYLKSAHLKESIKQTNKQTLWRWVVTQLLECSSWSVPQIFPKRSIFPTSY